MVQGQRLTRAAPQNQIACMQPRVAMQPEVLMQTQPHKVLALDDTVMSRILTTRGNSELKTVSYLQLRQGIQQREETGPSLGQTSAVVQAQVCNVCQYREPCNLHNHKCCA